MENEIVHTIGQNILITSKKVSEMLEVPHKVLLNTIESIIKKQNSNGTTMPLRYPQKFIETTFKTRLNRTFKMYDLNKQAYIKVAMHLSGYKKAELVQDLIIESFSLMEAALLNQSNSTWLDSRNKGKAIRKQETDTIQSFVEYATLQGSRNAKFYYSNITKMTNKALELLMQSKHGNPLKDLVSAHELGFITVIESKASDWIKEGMNNKLPYKFIYSDVKDKVNQLVEFLNVKKAIS